MKFRLLALTAAIAALTTACAPKDPKAEAIMSLVQLVEDCKASAPEQPQVKVSDSTNVPGNWNKSGLHHFEYSYDARASDSLVTPFVGVLTIQRWQQDAGTATQTPDEAKALPLGAPWPASSFQIQLGYTNGRWQEITTKFGYRTSPAVEQLTWRPEPLQWKGGVDYGFDPKVCAPKAI